MLLDETFKYSRGVPMAEALTSEQCQKMRHFLNALATSHRLAKERGHNKFSIQNLMTAYTKEYGTCNNRHLYSKISLTECQQVWKMVQSGVTIKDASESIGRCGASMGNAIRQHLGMSKRKIQHQKEISL